MTEERAIVNWSVSGLPPAYTEQRWHADVPATLRPDLDARLARTRFFDRPETRPAHQDAADAGTYRLTVTIGPRTRTVTFSDTSGDEDLADLLGWVRERLGPLATRE